MRMDIEWSPGAPFRLRMAGARDNEGHARGNFADSDGGMG
jgi:hypothetical protein